MFTPILPAAYLRPNPPTADAALVQLLDRDHSILAFNERVLDWAKRPEDAMWDYSTEKG